MFFRRTREERAKLKEEKRQLEELKKSMKPPEDQKTEVVKETNASYKTKNSK